MRRRVSLAIACAVVVLAVAETVSALVAPLRAPDDGDWQAAAAFVRAGHRDRDLLVAAPGWADPVLRQHLGDLVTTAQAARLDHRSYARVWELSQRGARAPETDDGRLREERRFGGLRVRLFERAALAPRYDFVQEWRQARVSRVAPGRPPVACAAGPQQHQCPDLGFNFVRPRLLEIGNGVRHALLAQPVADAAVVIEYPGVPLGTELAVGAGLHNVWQRKAGDGTVGLRVLVDGRELGRLESGNRTGWTVTRLDTRALAGRNASVRFEITSARPFARHFGFAAEARGR
jgi:hypothetical protein